MKNLLPLICLTSLLLQGAVRAENSAPTIELKHKSSFDAADARDPFLADRMEKTGTAKFLVQRRPRVFRPPPFP